MNEVTVYGENNSNIMTVPNAKGTATVIRPLRAKEWKAENAALIEGKSSRQTAALYRAYLERTVNNADLSGIGADMVRGRYGCERIRIGKDGRFQLSLVDKRQSDKAMLEEATSMVASMPEAVRQELLARLSALEAK